MFQQKLKIDYLNNVQKLYEILNILNNEISINIEILNKISENTKNIIDNMYELCQRNYLNAILSLLKADLMRSF